MGDVVDLHQPKRGDSCFMLCPCTDEGTPFMVVAIMGESPFIASLVCPECEQEAPVVNGCIGHRQD